MDKLNIHIFLQVLVLGSLILMLFFRGTRLFAYISIVLTLILSLFLNGNYPLVIFTSIVVVIAEALSLKVEKAGPVFISLRKRSYYFAIPSMITVIILSGFLLTEVFVSRELISHEINIVKNNWSPGLLLLTVLYFIKNLSGTVK